MMKAHNLQPIAALVTIVVLAGVTSWLIAGDPISQSKWDRVRTGMTKDQVLEIMGEPGSYDGSDQIEYSRPLNVGWVEFFFDEKNILIKKNDESAFGSLR